jgi:MoaA/NifB/PqqE/SkfB family radical SAM enzyme
MFLGRENGHSISTLESVFLNAIRFQRRGGLRKLWKLQAVFRHAVGSWSTRKKMSERGGFQAPIAIAFSPTMRCNLSCAGCYALDYPRDGELSLESIDAMLTSAERMGVFLFVITGGEPLLRDGILEVFRRHKKLLFLLITNGTLMSDDKARAIARAGNIIPVVSIEGSQEQTDARRGDGIYDQVRNSMEHLEKNRAVFGFSAMVTRENFGTLSSDQFIKEMLERGCAVGFYTEYIPLGSAARWELVLEEKEQKQFRHRILELRRSNPIMLAHLPDDEYGPDNKCLGVTGGCVHINSQGYVEPCPFTHLASDNIREKSLEEALQSTFLAQIRSSEAVCRRGRLGCALFENRELVQKIADNSGAESTDVDQ